MDLHDRFDDWLAGGAEGDPPRDLAVHASSCDACLRSAAAVDSFQAIDIGRASLPPLRMVATSGRDSLARNVRYAVGALAVVLLATSLAIGASGLLRPTPVGSGPEARSPREGVLAGVPSARVTAQPFSVQPTASPSERPQPSASPTSAAPVAGLATAAPFQVLPHSTPSPEPPGTLEPTAAPPGTPVPTAVPTAATTATPIVTPSPKPPSPSPSIVVPTPSPTPDPTPDPTPSPTPPPLPACSNLVDDDEDGLIDFPADPGCTTPLDEDEDEFAP